MTFARDNAWQLPIAINFLDPWYRACGWQVERYVGDHPMQRAHVDVAIRQGPWVHLIDEKIGRGRRDGRRAEKASIETWSCSVAGLERVGWMMDARNQATVVFFCFADTADLAPDAWQRIKRMDCLWVPFRPLRTWFCQQDENCWELQDNQQVNRSLSRKVPIDQIASNVPGVRRYDPFGRWFNGTHRQLKPEPW